MDVKVYQINYDYNQPGGDSIFLPYDNSHNNCERLHNHREYKVFLEAYTNRLCESGCYTGFVSRKFNKKTGWKGKEFIDRIKRDNFSQQVYFVNCGPTVKDVWLHGERRHRGILDLAQQAIRKVGMDVDLSNIHRDTSKTCFCNYWVGSSEFWDRYIDFTEPVYNHLVHDLSPEQREVLYTKADKGISSGLLPFIMERLFTTLLCIDGGISYMSIPKHR